jgi:hypothetical protein
MLGARWQPMRRILVRAAQSLPASPELALPNPSKRLSQVGCGGHIRNMSKQSSPPLSMASLGFPFALEYVTW